ALRHGRVQEAQQLLLLSGTNDAVHEPLCVYGVKVTPLLLAAQRGWFCMAKLLLEHGADGVPALFFAVLHGRTEMVKVLLKHGADITATDGEGHTALHSARDDHKNVIDLMTCMNIDKTDICNRTCLHFAVRRGAIRVVKELLMNNANTSIADSFGKT
ncbi:ankyrin repeat-containing domain protein, partial [Baffinella frigidus]